MEIVFYYKYTADFAKNLYRLSCCNKAEKVIVLDPIVSSNRNEHYFKQKKSIFAPNTEYVAIEYINHRIDPFFRETLPFVEACCFKSICVDLAFYNISVPITLYIEVLLPFMPKNKILKNFAIVSISLDTLTKGLYKIVFVRKCKYQYSTLTLMQDLHKDVALHIPNLPLLVIAVYTAHWLSR